MFVRVLKWRFFLPSTSFSKRKIEKIIEKKIQASSKEGIFKKRTFISLWSFTIPTDFEA